MGCGLGKVTIGVAKQITTGRVIGMDIWDTTEIPGNSPEAALKNAELEGVQDKVAFETGNILTIPFDDNSFDVVTSSSVLTMRTAMSKLKAVKNIYRVLKPGGIFSVRTTARFARVFHFYAVGFLDVVAKGQMGFIAGKSGLCQSFVYVQRSRLLHC